MLNLANNKHSLLGEFVERNLQIERGWALPDPARSIIMAAMARAVVSSKLPSISNGHTAKVGAHS